MEHMLWFSGEKEAIMTSLHLASVLQLREEERAREQMEAVYISSMENKSTRASVRSLEAKLHQEASHSAYDFFLPSFLPSLHSLDTFLCNSCSQHFL